ncbi:MAG: hypothetical protein GX374_05395, partial [Bacilli bacterium]|nr:hypothetical protein [Bacilli bacterium]
MAEKLHVSRRTVSN